MQKALKMYRGRQWTRAGRAGIYAARPQAGPQALTTLGKPEKHCLVQPPEGEGASGAPGQASSQLPPAALGLGSCRRLSAVRTHKVITGRPRPEGFPLLALSPRWVDSPDRS